MSSTDFVNVPVPAARVVEVYALLAAPPSGVTPVIEPMTPVKSSPSGSSRPGAPASGAGSAPVWTPPGPPGDDDVLPWTVATLRRMYAESAGNMRDALDYLADRGGAEVTTRELAAALGLPKGAASVAGMVGAFARRCWNRYGRYVPWVSWWQPVEDDTNTTETVFVMPPEIADLLREMRSG